MEEEKTNISVQIYPSSLIFKPTYPNFPSHHILFIQNPFPEPIKIQIEISGDRRFSIASNQFEIPQSSVHSAIITFISAQVGACSATLTVSSNSTKIDSVELKAKCIQSPLIIDYDSQFLFSRKNCSLTVNLANKSILHPLHVVFDIDSPAFTIIPNVLDFPPFSSSSVEISYNLEPTESSNLHIQCAETGDSIKIPLNILTTAPPLEVNYGSIPTGTSITKSLKIAKFLHENTTLSFSKATDLFEIESDSNSNINSILFEEEEELIFDSENTSLNSMTFNDKSDISSNQSENKHNKVKKENVNVNENENNIDRDIEEAIKNAVSSIKEPFSARASNGVMYLSFYSEEPGTFHQFFTVGNQPFSILAEAVEPPVAIECDPTQLAITNISPVVKKTKISFEDNEPNETYSLTANQTGIFSPTNSPINIQWKHNGQMLRTSLESPNQDLVYSSSELYFNGPTRQEFSLTNQTLSPKRINFNIDRPEFTLLKNSKKLKDNSIFIQPQSTETLTVDFNPKSLEPISGTMQLLSKDEIIDEISIFLLHLLFLISSTWMKIPKLELSKLEEHMILKLMLQNGLKLMTPNHHHFHLHVIEYLQQLLIPK